ncbi:MAG: nuclear transport factor 2 family protein, partial [Ilumatobacteraceae bacterium]
LERYFACIDRQDRAGLAHVFTPDVEIDYFDGAMHVEGLGALVDGPPPAFRSSMHALAHASITIDGDRAHADTYAVAHLLLDGDGPAGTLTTRGLRYVDELTRTTDGWLISHRRHIPLWQSDQTATPPSAPDALRR